MSEKLAWRLALAAVGYQSIGENKGDVYGRKAIGNGKASKKRISRTALAKMRLLPLRLRRTRRMAFAARRKATGRISILAGENNNEISAKYEYGHPA